MPHRAIIHVDMDCFFAAIEQRDNPDLIGKPVIIGADPKWGRGVVSTASYEARKFGVHSAMPISQAYARCPQGIYLRGSMPKYGDVSDQIMDIFERYTPLVEPVSLDEAFLDVTGSTRLFGSAVEIGRRIIADIEREVNLPASLGLAPNKFLAKIASDLEKPRGFVIVDPDRIEEFLFPLPIRRMWGIGPKSAEYFYGLGIHTIGDLAKLPIELLESRSAKTGSELWRLARGIDQREVHPIHQAKSVSHETTFIEDVSDLDVIKSTLLELTEAVSYRLRRYKLKGKVVTLKLRFDDFTTFTRAKSLAHRTHLTEEIYPAILDNLARLPDTSKAIRLVGVAVSHFDARDWRQLSFWDDASRLEKYEKVAEAMDSIKNKYGKQAIKRAATLQRPKRKERP